MQPQSSPQGQAQIYAPKLSDPLDPHPTHIDPSPQRSLYSCALAVPPRQRRLRGHRATVQHRLQIVPPVGPLLPLVEFAQVGYGLMARSVGCPYRACQRPVLIVLTAGTFRMTLQKHAHSLCLLPLRHKDQFWTTSSRRSARCRDHAKTLGNPPA